MVACECVEESCVECRGGAQHHGVAMREYPSQHGLTIKENNKADRIASSDAALGIRISIDLENYNRGEVSLHHVQRREGGGEVIASARVELKAGSNVETNHRVSQ